MNILRQGGLMPLVSADPALDARSVEQLVYQTWWNLDRHAGADGADFFCADAIVTMPARTMRGREEIAGGFQARVSLGPRLSRHLVCNLMVNMTGQHTARATYVLLVYAKDGVKPLQTSTYQAICDVDDEIVFEENRWLVAQRELTTVFLSPDNDSVLLATSS